MFDGFWSGVFGALFGPALACWVGRYRYLTIFLTVTIGVHVLSFMQDLIELAGHAALARVRQFTFTPVGLSAPMAISALAVLCVFVCVTLMPEKKE